MTWIIVGLFIAFIVAVAVGRIIYAGTRHLDVREDTGDYK